MKTQSETINFLEGLVRSGFSTETINEKLSNFFGEAFGNIEEGDLMVLLCTLRFNQLTKNN